MIYNYVADGSVIVGGDSECTADYYASSADGGVLASGSSESASSYFSLAGSGSLQASGSAVQRKNLKTSGSGSASLGASSASAVTRYDYDPFGSCAAGSSGLCVCRPTFSGSGSVSVSYIASSPSNFLSEWALEVSYDVYQTIEVYKDISYDVGDLPYRTWRVVGVEYYDCNNIPFCAVPNGLNRMFQEIIARSLTEVCQFLTDVNWTWPIAEVQRSVYPAEAFIAVGSTGLNTLGYPVPSTNQFVSVPFSQVPECLFLSVPTTEDISMGMSSEIEIAFPYSASGSVQVSGSSETTNSFSGSGHVLLSGSAECFLASRQYESSGSMQIVGESEITKDSWSYEATGFVLASGESLEGSQYFNYFGSGNVSTDSTAASLVRLSFASSGGSDVYPNYAGVNVGGDASYPILQAGTGSVQIYGAGASFRKSYSYFADGSALLDGMSVSVSPYQQYAASGGVAFSGDIVVGKASFQIVVDDSSPISFGGTSPNRDSSSGSFWYTALLQEILTSGTSTGAISSFYYDGSGSAAVDGAVDCDVYLAGEVSAGMFALADFVEISFGSQFANNLPAVTNDITTTCSGCPAIPNVLYLSNNLAKASVFKEFMVRNNIELGDYFTLYYNSSSDSWQTSLHYSGVGGDNSQAQENWQINMEWSCTSQYGEDYLSSSMWKFALYMRQKNMTSGKIRETRMVILFASEYICQQASAFALDFTFDFHFRSDYVTNSLGFSVDVFNHYDTLGAFSGSYWDTNNFTCRVSTVPTVGIYNTIDISAERPAPRQQFYV